MNVAQLKAALDKMPDDAPIALSYLNEPLFLLSETPNEKISDFHDEAVIRLCSRVAFEERVPFVYIGDRWSFPDHCLIRMEP